MFNTPRHAKWRNIKECTFALTCSGESFHLWTKYRREQLQRLLLNNPKDIMVGTKIYDGIVYAYVTVIKANSTKDDLKYVDGYIDEKNIPVGNSRQCK